MGPFYSGQLLVSKSTEFLPREASVLILQTLNSGLSAEMQCVFILDITLHISQCKMILNHERGYIKCCRTSTVVKQLNVECLDKYTNGQMYKYSTVQEKQLIVCVHKTRVQSALLFCRFNCLLTD